MDVSLQTLVPMRKVQSRVHKTRLSDTEYQAAGREYHCFLHALEAIEMDTPAQVAQSSSVSAAAFVLPFRVARGHGPSLPASHFDAPLVLTSVA